MISELTETLRENAFWSEFFRSHRNRIDWALHVAIFREPFLSWVLEGKKRVESRFSQNQIAPFGAVNPGDVIALKRAGGPVVGLCLAGSTWSYRLDPKTWGYIRQHFTPSLCADDEFWASRKNARFATLISLDQVTAITPIEYPKNDRRGWVIEHNRITQRLLEI